MEYLKLINFLNTNVTFNQNIDQKICFFPGTFYPWHAGHEACVELHSQKFADIPLVILPDHNPRKSHHLNSEEFIQLSNKLQTQKLLVPYTKNLLSDSLLENKNANPTYQWIGMLKANFPKTHLGLLMGKDCFLQIDTWQHTEDLLSNLNFIEVVPRQYNDHQKTLNDQINYCKSIKSSMEIHLLPSHPYLALKSSTQRM